MYVDDSTLLSDIQSTFRKEFPYLCLEFHLPAGGTLGSDAARRYTLAAYRIRTNLDAAPSLGLKRIQCDPEMTVRELIGEFENSCRVAIQVHRYSGASWVRIDSTAEWTLAYQNEQGRVLAEHFDGHEGHDGARIPSSYPHDLL